MNNPLAIVAAKLKLVVQVADASHADVIEQREERRSVARKGNIWPSLPSSNLAVT